MGIVAHDSVRSLKTLAIVEPFLSTSPITEQQLKAKIRGDGNHYNWNNGEPPELGADLAYLHGISGLTKFNGMYTRGNLIDYWLGRV